MEYVLIIFLVGASSSVDMHSEGACNRAAESIVLEADTTARAICVSRILGEVEFAGRKGDNR